MIKISIDKASAVPYYFQIKEAVKAMIAGGEIKPGDMLPSEMSLSESLTVSRLTIHRAYRELAAEGALVRRRAKGTFVALPKKPVYLVEGPLFGVTESLTQAGVSVSTRVLVQEVIRAGEEVRKELDLPAGSRVVHLHSVRSLDRTPFSVETLYLPHDRFPALAILDLNDRSIYATLEKLYDAHPQEALDRISAGAATVQESALLGLRKRQPVMRVKRTSTDRTGRPVEYALATYVAERYQVVARVHRVLEA